MGMKKTLWQAAAILAISFVGAALTKWLHPHAPAWYRVENVSGESYRLTLEELRKRYLPEQLLWIDARTAADFASGHVEGAHLLNDENWSEQIWNLRDQFSFLDGRTVVVYCDGAACKRSAAIGQRLRGELGIEPVWVLDGDWRDW